MKERGTAEWYLLWHSAKEAILQLREKVFQVGSSFWRNWRKSIKEKGITGKRVEAETENCAWVDPAGYGLRSQEQKWDWGSRGSKNCSPIGKRGRRSPNGGFASDDPRKKRGDSCQALASLGSYSIRTAKKWRSKKNKSLSRDSFPCREQEENIAHSRLNPRKRPGRLERRETTTEIKTRSAKAAGIAGRK